MMNKIIIFLGIAFLLFMAIYTEQEQQKQQEIKKSNPNLFEDMNQKPPAGPIWPNYKWALKSTQDKLNERALIQRSSITGEGRCNEPRSIEEKMQIEFAGYLLEYPCTAVISGSSYTHLVQFKQPHIEFNLHLMMSLNPSNETIWRQNPNVNKGDEMSSVIYLKSDNINDFKRDFIQQMIDADEIKEMPGAELKIYRTERKVVGFLTTQRDASNQPPAIHCDLAASAEVEDYFSPSQDFNKPHLRSCSAIWMLTEDIHVFVRTVKSQHVYYFRELYQKVNRELIQSIRKYRQPEGVNASREDLSFIINGVRAVDFIHAHWKLIFKQT